jgi:hypothetical protein
VRARSWCMSGSASNMVTTPGSYADLAAFDAATQQTAPAVPLADTGQQSNTQTPLVSFIPTGAPSVAIEGFYVTVDDQLVVTAWNSNAALTSLTFAARILNPDGSITVEQFAVPNLTADRTPNTVAFAQLEGFLLGVAVGPPGVANSRGQTFVNVSVQRGFPQSAVVQRVLIADYVSSGFQPGWPASRVTSAVEGAGFTYTFAGSVPGAGVDASVAVPAGARWRVISVWVHVLTSAQAGVRQLRLQISQTGGQVYEITAASTQGPSTGNDYSWSDGVPQLPVAFLAQVNPTPHGLLLSKGGQINFALNNIQSADQYTAAFATVEEWIEV